jgi:CRP-like cAMP-binding protein
VPKVKLGLTHGEIVQIIGTSQESETRVLAGFRKRQIAVLKGFQAHHSEQGHSGKLVAR